MGKGEGKTLSNSIFPRGKIRNVRSRLKKKTTAESEEKRVDRVFPIRNPRREAILPSSVGRIPGKRDIRGDDSSFGKKKAGNKKPAQHLSRLERKKRGRSSNRKASSSLRFVTSRKCENQKGDKRHNQGHLTATKEDDRDKSRMCFNQSRGGLRGKGVACK